jgi:hypothetical protein
MKRIFFAIAILGLFLAAAPKADARVNVSVNFFYNNLNDGYWLDVAGYGYCWQPNIAVRDRRWRPYADGYWAYTNVGWTWVSYEPFGWATYHYGRWARIRGYGWVWVPGYEWGPAWVSWRVGRNYVGWAPLPPRRYVRGGEPIYYGRPIRGYVDVEFDIGPAYYNFVDIRYIGAPVLSRHIVQPTQNITYISQTVNVTNITYQNNTIHNYGPDYNRLSAYSTQPIQRLTLQRAADVPPEKAAQDGGFTRVQGNTLVVAAPSVIEKPAESITPPQVKTRVEEANLETGWSEIADEKTRARIVEQMKKEDPKNVPPPDIAPVNPEALKAAQAGATPPPPDAAATPAADAVGAAPAPVEPPARERERGRGRARDVGANEDGIKTAEPSPAPGAAPGAEEPAAIKAPADRRRGRGRDAGANDEARDASMPTPPPATGAAAGEADAAPAPGAIRQGRGRGRDAADRAREIDREPAVTAPPTGESPGGVQEQPRGNRRERPQRPRDIAVPEEQIQQVQPGSTIDREQMPGRPVVPPVVEEERGEAPQRGGRGRGRGNDRGEAAPAFQPPREVQEIPREVRQPRPQPQEIQPAPQQPVPQQVVPQEAAPQEERQRGGRGKGKPQRERPDEQDE